MHFKRESVSLRSFKHHIKNKKKNYKKVFAVQVKGYQIQENRGKQASVMRHRNYASDATTHRGFSLGTHFSLKWLMLNRNIRSTKPQLTTTFWLLLSLWYLRKTLLFISCNWQEKLVLQKCRIQWWQSSNTSNIVGEPFRFLFQVLKTKQNKTT